MMTPDNVKRFETLQDLFTHKGWGILLDEFEFKEASLKEQFCQFGIAPELLLFGQGRISVYRELAGLPAIIDQALKPEEDDEPNTF
jgi:hypothetical protein